MHFTVTRILHPSDKYCKCKCIKKCFSATLVGQELSYLDRIILA